MIKRMHYRAAMSSEMNEETLAKLLEKDAPRVKRAIEAGRCLTVAMYRHKDMLFLYLESMDETLRPIDIFPAVTHHLELWPEKDGPMYWVHMYHIYYHDIPDTKERWARVGKKQRRGRIAYLFDETLFSYVYWHKAIVDEGLLEGDMYQSIALHENILFSYFEEPKIFTHIKKDIDKESEVIKGWLDVNPESHFDHSLSGEENFLLLPEVFSMGAEDL